MFLSSWLLWLRWFSFSSFVCTSGFMRFNWDYFDWSSRFIISNERQESCEGQKIRRNSVFHFWGLKIGERNLQLSLSSLQSIESQRATGGKDHKPPWRWQQRGYYNLARDDPRTSQAREFSELREGSHIERKQPLHNNGVLQPGIPLNLHPQDDSPSWIKNMGNHNPDLQGIPSPLRLASTAPRHQTR